MRKLVLASGSPRRKEILERLHVPFVIEPSDYEEDMTMDLPPRELAETLATGKADAVAIKHDDAIIIGADTFIEFEGIVLGKPFTEEKALDTLRLLSGRTHEVHTGYCIIDSKNGARRSGVETTRVTFRMLSEEEIAAYVATGEPLLAAGAYFIQSGAAGFVSGIEGEYLNVVGLPLGKITEELRALGIHV